MKMEMSYELFFGPTGNELRFFLANHQYVFLNHRFLDHVKTYWGVALHHYFQIQDILTFTRLN